MTLTLLENVFAKVKIPYDALPPCFEVKRVQVSEEPLQVSAVLAKSGED